MAGCSKYEPITTQFTLLNLMAYVFRNPRKLCYWKNYWESGAWECSHKQPTLVDPQGLERCGGITIQQIMEIVDRTIDHDGQHLELLAKVRQEYPVLVDVFKTVEI
ncbi:MAG: hypothetical protein SPD11_01515 [Sphaerochaetaceae bacterium]|nr:hypothetical protein [Sphaerochaetaceae bacterium]